MLESIVFREKRFRLLDQVKLPNVVEYVDIESVEDGWHAIRDMKVRGAPAIAITAMIALLVELYKVRESFGSDKLRLADFVKSRCTYLCTSRPTAVNIQKAADDVVERCDKLVADGGVTFDDMFATMESVIVKMLEDDVSVNKSIGDFGANHILKYDVGDEPVRILTHCNTGSLATSGYGTALGVIRSLHRMGKLEQVYCTETRPYNQGSRLTAYELVAENIPGTLICDNMVAALMKSKKISAVVVGADRVVSNGDTANKIGTYQIAVAAKYHQVPFYIASPMTTIDFKLKTGDEIPIEERPADEIKVFHGIPTAPSGINCWNPAFDVTPGSLIRGIITEFGVFAPDQLHSKLGRT